MKPKPDTRCIVYYKVRRINMKVLKKCVYCREQHYRPVNTCQHAYKLLFERSLA